MLEMSIAVYYFLGVGFLIVFLFWLMGLDSRNERKNKLNSIVDKMPPPPPAKRKISKKNEQLKRRKGMPCEECKHLICVYNGGNSIDCDLEELSGHKCVTYCGKFEPRESNEASGIIEEFR